RHRTGRRDAGDQPGTVPPPAAGAAGPGPDGQRRHPPDGRAGRPRRHGGGRRDPGQEPLHRRAGSGGMRPPVRNERITPMITKRIIPCLDVRNGRVVKGVNFEGVRDVADPVEMARMYNAAGADELVFYDITASYEGRALFTDILTQVASEIFIPLTVGGGINTLEDFDRVLQELGRG